MKELDNLLASQAQYFHNTLLTNTVSQRIVKIRKIRDWIQSNKSHIADLCLKDYHKPISEFYSTEINPVLNHIDFTLKNIKNWACKKSVWTPMSLIGTRSKIYYEPKGVCLIISPWNYPFNLTLNPVISAVAAGNCIVVKPSEHTPSTSGLLHELLSSIFDRNEVAVVQGNATIGSYLINLKFNHIFFTGSPEIGSLVMGAAAKNLTSITLELGGKNHTIVDRTANMKDAAEKILWSKYVNCGQTCIAVNHVFIEESSYDMFITALEHVLVNFCRSHFHYASVVNEKHVVRLQKLLGACCDAGGKILFQSPNIEQKNYFPLTVVGNVTTDNPIVKNEVFGPILAVVKYNNFDNVLDFINEGDKALALYLFSKSKKQISKFIQKTSSGTVAINECMLQYANPHLLFGGVNSSGMGKVGRKRGFLAFSNEKSVLFQVSGFSIAKFIYPPYTNFKKKLAKFLR